MSLKKKTLKKAISMVTALTTIVWLSGISMFAVSVDVASAAIVDGALISSNATNSDGTPTLESLDVYIVKLVGAKKFKRLILNPQVFNSYQHFNWNSVQEVNQSVLDEYTTSNLVRVDGDPAEKVYGLAPDGDTGAKGWINLTSTQFLTEGGADADSVYTINSTDAGNYTAVGDVTTVNQLTTFLAKGTLPSTTPVPTGEISVSLSSSTPVAGTLVAGQAVADLAHFTLSGTGTVKGVTLKRIGVSADTTPSNVYLFDGETRITDGASVTTGSTITFTDSSKIFDVSGSKTISVRADIAASTAGQTVGVQLTSVTLASGTTTGLPVSGNIHSVASATLATVALSASTASGNVDPGNGIVVWQSTATVGTRDVALKRLALRQIGSIVNADIKNFKLLVDGSEITTVDSLDSNGYVTFSVNQTMKSGARIIKVTADVIGGSGRTVQLSLRGTYDITTVDSQYNANILATGTFANSPTAFTVNAGTMTVVKATGSASGNVTKGASDISLATYDFTAYGEAIKIETLKVGVLQTGAADSTTVTLRNVRVMVDGSQVGSTTDVPSAASYAAASGTQFTTNFTVNPGTPVKVELRADIVDSEGTDEISAAGSTVTNLQMLLVGGTGTSNAIPKVSLGTMNVPSAVNTTANTVTVAAGSLNITKTSNYGNQSIVVPRTTYKLGSFQLSGNSTEIVTVNEVEIDFTGSGTFDASDDLTDVYIVYGGTKQTIKGSVADSNNTWSLSNELAKNGTVAVDVYGTIGSTITAGDTMRADITVTGVTKDSAATVYADVTSSNTTKDAGFQGQTITASSGTITATKDASSPVAQIVDDSGNIVSGAFKFETTNDSYTVTDITLTLGDVTAVQNVKIREKGTTDAITGGTKPAATTMTFNGLSVPVGANTNKVLEVVLEMGTVGTGAGSSGASLLTTLTAATAENSQGTSAAVTESNPAANAMYVYKTIPTISNVNLPDGNLTSGTPTVAKFTVATSGNGTMSWKKLIFTVTKDAGPILATATLWDGATQIAGTATHSTTGASDTSGTITFVATDEQQISDSKTYSLKADVTGTIESTDAVSTKIAQPSSYVAPTDYTTVAATTASFVWSDVSAQSHSTSTSDWSNGYLVKNLPTDGQTLN